MEKCRRNSFRVIPPCKTGTCATTGTPSMPEWTAGGGVECTDSEDFNVNVNTNPCRILSSAVVLQMEGSGEPSEEYWAQLESQAFAENPVTYRRTPMAPSTRRQKNRRSQSGSHSSNTISLWNGNPAKRERKHEPTLLEVCTSGVERVRQGRRCELIRGSRIGGHRHRHHTHGAATNATPRLRTLSLRGKRSCKLLT